MINYSGFPEPFTRANPRFHRRWKQDYVDRLVKEDIRDLTQIIETERIANMIHLLPERVGSPLSLNSMKEDLGVSYNAVKSSVSALRLIFAIFLPPPTARGFSGRSRKRKNAIFTTGAAAAIWPDGLKTMWRWN